MNFQKILIALLVIANSTVAFAEPVKVWWSGRITFVQQQDGDFKELQDRLSNWAVGDRFEGYYVYDTDAPLLRVQNDGWVYDNPITKVVIFGNKKLNQPDIVWDSVGHPNITQIGVGNDVYSPVLDNYWATASLEYVDNGLWYTEGFAFECDTTDLQALSGDTLQDFPESRRCFPPNNTSFIPTYIMYEFDGGRIGSTAFAITPSQKPEF